MQVAAEIKVKALLSSISFITRRSVLMAPCALPPQLVIAGNKRLYCFALKLLRSGIQEDSFHLVDNRPAQKNKGQRRFNPQRFAHRNTQFNRGQPEQPHQARQKQQKQRQFQNFHRDNQRVHCLGFLLLKATAEIVSCCYEILSTAMLLLPALQHHVFCQKSLSIHYHGQIIS